ncbi:hypothetical protein Enr13x_09540 [Stieleria neptunia]|uniref:Uncharacterized protein n=1 Tax=Stieleria neptunia TaxID=2527979 RepID=A0A518HJT5_9BACT|nr:hypothetical protein Enr13x_09540 [Stieleria neptunia]
MNVFHDTRLLITLSRRRHSRKTFTISRQRELTLISRKTTPPPLRCIPWFVVVYLGESDVVDKASAK